MALSEPVRKQISDLVTNHQVVLFMKGTRRLPQCGFSAQVVQILDELLPTYETVDVLRSPEIREGIKEFSEWPTLPQLYVGGKFVGGCDIVRDLKASGELEKLDQSRWMKTVIDAIREAIEQRIPDAKAEVSGADGHFTIAVTSIAFAGKSMLESHRMVYAAITHLMKGEGAPLHAVDSLRTTTG